MAWTPVPSPPDPRVYDGPMAEAGWYADPHNPEQMRYWDGSTWTEHTHVPEAAVPGSATRPPFSPPPPSGPPAVRPAPETVNDIGEWLRASFRVAWRKLGICFALTMLGILPFLIVPVLVVLALFDLDLTGDQVQGFGGADVVLLIIAGLAALAGMVWFGVTVIAQYRVLYDAHRDRSIGIGAALAVGRRNIWRLVVAYLIIYLLSIAALIAFFAIVALLFFVAAGASFDSPESLEAVGPLLNLINLITVPVTLWLSVKLAFVPVAAAVAPQGQGLIRLSMGVSDGRFWAVLGRVLLLSLVMVAVIFPLQILFVVLVGLGAVALGTSGDSSIAFVVLLAMFGGLLFGVVLYFAQIMQASGLSRLYADLGGPTVE